MIRKLFAATALLAVAACSQSYESAQNQSGYKETKVDDTTFEIRMAGGGTSADAVGNSMNLVRAAEMTLDAGYTHFKAIKSTVEEANTTALYSSIERHQENVLLFQMLNDAAAKGALDAREVIAKYGPKVKYAGKYATAG